MKCIKSGWGIACLAASWLVASGAVAQSVNPFSPSVADVQAVVDKTASDSGNTQLSTINSITNLPNGIELDITFRVGVGTADPFDPNFGQNFARVTLERDTAGSPLDLSAFDGYKLTVLSSVGSFVQPYLKTGAGFKFYEAAGGGFGVTANATTDIVQAFTNSRSFGPFVEPDTVANSNDVKALGIQFIGNGVVVGQPLQATIRVTTDGVIPEPSTLALGGLGLAALAAAARRRR